MRRLVFAVIVLVLLFPAIADPVFIESFDIYVNPTALVDETIKKAPAEGRKKLRWLEDDLLAEIRKQKDRRIFWINTL